MRIMRRSEKTCVGIAWVGLVLIAARADADELRLVGEKVACRCAVVAVDEKSVEFRTRISEVERFSVGARRDTAFPDLLRLKGHRRDRKARVLVWERGRLLLRVPRAEVARIMMEERTADGAAKGTGKKSGAPAKAAGRKPALDKAASGSASGRVLDRGKPARGVTIRVVRIEVSTFLGVKRSRDDESFAATTDEHGSYRLEALPPGAYKIYVQLKKDEGWVRRLRDDPDFKIVTGKHTGVGPVRIPARVH